MESAEPKKQAPDPGSGARRSTSYIDWATLMRRGLGIHVLDCPKCQDRMAPLSVITEQDVITRILTHLQMPMRPEKTEDGTVVYDVTEEPVLAQAALWQEVGYESRGPPSEWDGVDDPSPTE